MTTQVQCSCGHTSHITMAGKTASYCPNCGCRVFSPAAKGEPSQWTIGRLVPWALGGLASIWLLQHWPHSAIPDQPPAVVVPPQIAQVIPTPAPPLPPPVAIMQGDQEMWTPAPRIAPFTVKTPDGSNSYYLKLVDANTNQPVISLFVFPAQEYHTTVPLGAYKLRYAYGPIWYGTEQFFGPQTIFKEGDRVFNFTQENNQLKGHIVSLINQPMGNMYPQEISRQAF
ncbi:hypothetical protein ACFPAG_11655 [Vogesella sp. GCM10023246]|uniref:Uncharacterized protein n=1 Tax=Vogesella oryzagri TaxID=3160864 RepID=A0ABV1M5H7_9NEIS